MGVAGGTKGGPPHPGRRRDPQRAGSSAPQGQDPTSPGPADPAGGRAEAQPVELEVCGSPTPTPRPTSTLTRQTSQAWGPARTPRSCPVLATPSLWPDLPCTHPLDGGQALPGGLPPEGRWTEDGGDR